MKSPSIYIAGASKEPLRVRSMMERATHAGFAITLDWLAAIEAEGAANEGLDDEKRRRYANADFDAVGRADFVWLLAPDNASTGAWAELGYAIGVRAIGGMCIVVSGPARAKCIFASLADYESDQDAEAFAWLRARAGL